MATHLRYCNPTALSKLVWPSPSLNKLALWKYWGELLLCSWASMVSALLKCNKESIEEQCWAELWWPRSVRCVPQTLQGGKCSGAAALCPSPPDCRRFAVFPFCLFFCFPSKLFASSWLLSRAEAQHLVGSLEPSLCPGAQALSCVAMGRGCLLPIAPGSRAGQDRSRLSQHTAGRVHELLWYTHWGEKKEGGFWQLWMHLNWAVPIPQLWVSHLAWPGSPGLGSPWR